METTRLFAEGIEPELEPGSGEKFYYYLLLHLVEGFLLLILDSEAYCKGHPCMSVCMHVRIL